MPRLRKLTASEIDATEDELCAFEAACRAAAALADGATVAPRPGRTVRTVPPLVGDVVDVPGQQRGIVLGVRRAHDGSWDYAEMVGAVLAYRTAMLGSQFLTKP